MAKIEQAMLKIQRFRDRFEPRYGDGHYHFACQAAFLIGFTPNLLYQLWANFREYPKPDGSTGAIDLIAVSDLLLSPLCRQTGRDIFEMEVEVRTLLLEELRKEPFASSDRLRDIAYFLFQYLDSNSEEFRYQTFRETLYWNTLVTLSPALAMEQLTQKLSDSIRNNDEGEIFRLRGLLEAFAYQDQGLEQAGESDFFKLMNYTKALKASLLNYPQAVVDQQLKESGAWTLTTDPGQSLQTIKLPLLEKMVGQVEVPKPESELSVEVDLEVKEIFILLVGIDQYAQYPPLTGCANDVRSVDRVLRKKLGNAPDWELYFYQLLNEQATAAAVQEKLREILDRAGPEDLVFFLFSGRAFNEPQIQERTGLVFHGTKVEIPGEGTNSGGVSNTFNLEELLLEYPDTSVVLSIDAPHAAGVLQLSPPHVALLAACRTEEQSRETRYEEKAFGVFTFSLVQVLEEHPGFPSYEELVDRIREKISSRYEQTPQLVTPSQNRYRRFLQETFFDDSEVFRRIEAVKAANNPDLDLSELQLTAIPDEVFRMAFLERVDLRDNRLTVMPTELTLLVKLQVLNLAGNRISGINPAVLEMRSLRKLDLNGNPLENIPPEVVNEGLHALRRYIASRRAEAQTLHLLLVGADHYDRFPNASVPGTEKELTNLGNAIAKKFEGDFSINISPFYLLGKEASRGRVLEHFQVLQSATTTGDTVLVCFAGHDTRLDGQQGENVLIMPDSQSPPDGSRELRPADFQPLIEWAAGTGINLILINPPEGTHDSPPSNVAIIDPGKLNNMESAQGIFTSIMLDLLEEDEMVTYGELEKSARWEGNRIRYSRSRTDKQYDFRLITDPVNRNKRFLRDPLGPDRRIRERIREARRSGAPNLDLSGLEMTEVPAEILEMKQLHRLDLSNNQIRILPAAILRLEDLKELVLHGNPILNLPPKLVEAGNWQAVVDFFTSVKAVEPGPPLIVFIFSEMMEELASLPRELGEQLDRLSEKGVIRVEMLHDPTTEELYRFFLAHRHYPVEILNISANGDVEGLVFSGDNNTIIDAVTLAGLLVAPENVRLLISDANRSAAWTGKMISHGVGAAIGVKESHSVAVAAAFWRAFYGELAAGATIREAFNTLRKTYEQTGAFLPEQM